MQPSNGLLNVNERLGVDSQYVLWVTYRGGPFKPQKGLHRVELIYLRISVHEITAYNIIVTLRFLFDSFVVYFVASDHEENLKLFIGGVRIKTFHFRYGFTPRRSHSLSRFEILAGANNNYNEKGVFIAGGRSKNYCCSV